MSSHTDYTAFKNKSVYGAILAVAAPGVFVNLSKKVAHPDPLTGMPSAGAVFGFFGLVGIRTRNYLFISSL